ncbi:MAG: trypsin-like serine protease [Verrucomicrobiota bacterium]
MNEYQNHPVYFTVKYILFAALLLPSFLFAEPPLPSARDFATEMMNATFKWIDQSGSASTCFLMRREAPDTALYLVTAAHSFDGIAGETAVIVLRKPNADGSYQRHEHTFPICRGEKPLWVRNEKHDVAVLRIADPFPVPVAALPVSAIADADHLKASAVHLCSPLFVLCYPKSLEADGSGLPVARQGIFASPPLLPLSTRPTFFADYKACPGDSGAPVFIAGADNHPLIVGVVTEQQYYVDELKGMYEEHTIRTPLGFGIILHAQYVRETLEAAAKQGEF